MTYFRLPVSGKALFFSLIGGLSVAVLPPTSSVSLSTAWAASDSTDIQIAPPRQEDSVYGAYLAVSHAEEMAAFERASDLLDRLLLETPDDQHLERRALLANLYAGRLDRATTLAESVIEKAPGTVDIATLLMIADAVKQEDWALARSLLVDRQRLTLARFVTPVALAWISAGEGNIDGAIEELQELRDEEQVSDLHDYNAALIFLIAGRGAEADAILAPYADELERAPVLMIRALARARAETEGAEMAIALLEAYAEVRGEIDRIKADIASLQESGSLPLLAEGPAAGIAQTMVELAIRVRRQAPRIALRYLRTAVHLDDGNDLGRFVIGSVMDTFGRHDAALSVLSEIPETSVHSWVARQEIAENLTRLERDEEAIALLEAMSDERTEQFATLERLGGLMRTRNRFEEGIAFYDRALERVDPDDPIAWNLYYGRGICYERIKQWDTAEPDFLKALELNPDEPYVLNYLGYSWVDQGVRLDEGLDLIERAVNQRPNDAYIVDSLGWVHYRLGNFDEAVVQLERSVQLRPGNAIINDHLGDAYWHVGRRTEAQFQWERSKFLEDSDDKLRARIEDKLERGLDAVEADEAAAE